MPWARPWQVPGGEVLSRHWSQLGWAMFQHVFTVVARAMAAGLDQLRPGLVAQDRPAAGWLGDLLLCSGDGIGTRVADGDNREEFGSLGTSDDQFPLPPDPRRGGHGVRDPGPARRRRRRVRGR